ncbi:MAG TPA: hypothetical protein VHI77_09605 [Solirubrobacterales bacterium]|jgi:hypothetical protein|nr:hypothetical protein [Solirubrobacterales bacterium]
MKGKLKGLGLALAAIFAMSALVAQGAQAVETTEHTFNSEVEPTVFTGGLDPGFQDKLTIGSATFTCTSAVFESTAVGQAFDLVTLTPTWGSTTKPSGCSGAGQEFIYHTNHCAFVYESDTVLTPGTEDEHAPVEIECSGTEENEITITIPSIGVTIHIPAQKPADGVVYTNIGAGSTREITVHKTLKSIKGTCKGVNCFLIGLSNGKEFTTATYEGTNTIAGFKDEGFNTTGTAKTTTTSEDLKHGAQVGVFMTTP